MAHYEGVGRRSAAPTSDPDAHLECRQFEVAGHFIDLRQDLRGSGALRPLDDDRVWSGEEGEAVDPPILTANELRSVGLVAWQAGFVLADWLLRHPPFGSWHGASVLDLGCGTGLVGILLALAGADVTLSDQAHITPLTELNARANLTPGLHRWRTADHTWGQGDAAATMTAAGAGPPTPLADLQISAASGVSPAGGVLSPAQQQLCAQSPGSEGGVSGPGSGVGPGFDVITAADVVYQPECYAALAATLRTMSAPHTLVFVAFKRRGLQEDSFLDMLEGHGFALQDVPEPQLSPEYQTGNYRVVRACRIE